VCGLGVFSGTVGAMADWVTISSLATAGGTLVLAVATFSSVKSANRSARVAEQSMLLGTRPVLIPSREVDPTERVRFGDETFLNIAGHGAEVQESDGRIHMGIGLRNGGAGLAVILGWRARTPVGVEERTGQSLVNRQGELPAPSLADFRRQQLDLYIPAGETGFWQGGLYDPEEPGYRDVIEALRSNGVIYVDLLYGDHEGNQRMIVRFGMSEWPHDGDEEIGLRAYVLRYWDSGDQGWPPADQGSAT
jgi:hypothetical protein